MSFALHFGDFSMGVNFGRSMAIRGFGGMALIVLGMILAGLGRAGAAGSGIVLDPEKARRDVEPWSRMQGGMAKDALDEAGISLGASSDRRINHLPLDEQLRRLYQLRDDGIITEDEYTSKKRQILERM
ncbi:MAG: SHOCT domain-containing protein [Chthoniobacterales bacterium]